MTGSYVSDHQLATERFPTNALRTVPRAVCRPTDADDRSTRTEHDQTDRPYPNPLYMSLAKYTHRTPRSETQATCVVPDLPPCVSAFDS